MSETHVPPSTAAEHISIDNPFERIVGVFTQPVATFQSIARKPDWLVPMLLIMAFALVSAFLTSEQIDFEQTIRDQMQGREMSEQQREQAVEMGTKMAKFGPYMGLIFLPLMILIAAAVMMLGHKLMGGAGSFAQYFSATTYAWFPQMLLSLIVTIVLMFSEPMSINEMLVSAYSNPGFLIDASSNPVLFAFVTKLDVFTIWSVVLMIIGYSIVSGFSRAKSAAVVIALWVVYILFSLVGPLMGSMARQR
jgi:hypothetical protein